MARGRRRLSFLHRVAPKSYAGKAVLSVAGALGIFVASFSVASKTMDYWRMWPVNPLNQPVVDVTKLPHLAPRQILDLSIDKNRGALLSGWSYPESGGTWTLGHAAFVAFIVSGTAGKGLNHVSLHAIAFVSPSALTKQHIQVWSASDELAEFDLKQREADLLIPLYGYKFVDDAPLVLGFYLPDAASPASVHLNNDKRVLALKVSSLQYE